MTGQVNECCRRTVRLLADLVSGGGLVPLTQCCHVQQPIRPGTVPLVCIRLAGHQGPHTDQHGTTWQPMVVAPPALCDVRCGRLDCSLQPNHQGPHLDEYSREWVHPREALPPVPWSVGEHGEIRPSIGTVHFIGEDTIPNRAGYVGDPTYHRHPWLITASRHCHDHDKLGHHFHDAQADGGPGPARWPAGTPQAKMQARHVGRIPTVEELASALAAVDGCMWGRLSDGARHEYRDKASKLTDRLWAER